jgi:maleate isomerase
VKRVGFIIPSSNRMVEQEMTRALPDGVTAHIARLRMTGPFERPIDELVPAVTEATSTLDDARCDAIAFHCTANSTGEGRDGEERLLTAMRRAARGAITTTATAIREALETLSARTIALVTPYPRDVTEHETLFFTAAGYRVAAISALDLGGSDAFCSAPPETWEAAVLATQRDDIDAYVLSCANIACFSVIERIERALQRPLVTSNQSILWATLCAAGAARPSGLGRLMAAAPIGQAV